MEYDWKSLCDLFNQQGTISHRPCPYTSQQNGRANRKYCHILDIVGALLLFYF